MESFFNLAHGFDRLQFAGADLAYGRRIAEQYGGCRRRFRYLLAERVQYRIVSQNYRRSPFFQRILGLDEAGVCRRRDQLHLDRHDGLSIIQKPSGIQVTALLYVVRSIYDVVQRRDDPPLFGREVFEHVQYVMGARAAGSRTCV